MRIQLFAANGYGDEDFPCVEIPTDGEPEFWFCCHAILKYLELEQSILKAIPPEDWKVVTYTDENDGQAKTMLGISESACYILAAMSTKETTSPRGEMAFFKWIFHEVLVNIRKGGAHVEPQLVRTNQPIRNFEDGLRKAADANELLRRLAESEREASPPKDGGTAQT